MKRATVTAARSVQPFTRSFASSSSRHAGDWDRAKSTDNTLAHALNFVSGRTRLTQPSATAYNTVLKQAIDHSDQYDTKYAVEPVSGRHVDLQSLPFDIAINALAEAEKERVTLGEEAAELISRFASRHPKIIPSLLLETTQDGNHPASLYEALADSSRFPLHPDQLVYIVLEMLDRGLEPSNSLVSKTVRACCEHSSPRLALEIIQQIESASSTGFEAHLMSWVELLIVSAERQYLEGVLAAWAKIKDNRQYTPDSGLVGRILNVAARWGNPELATQALASLGDSGQSLDEHHLVALMECYVAAGQVPEAFRVVSMVRGIDLVPTLATVEPIAAILTTPELIDQAFYALEDMHKAGESVDLAAINALILASARIGDLRRVRATQASLVDFGLAPDNETFHSVLDGCVRAGHRALGDTVLLEMQAANIPADHETYEKLIQLCLLPDQYEDAFYYLEKMKAEDMRPSSSAYQAIIRKCLRARDRRWELVREEMKLLGYVEDFSIRQMIKDRRLGDEQM